MREDPRAHLAAVVPMTAWRAAEEGASIPPDAVSWSEPVDAAATLRTRAADAPLVLLRVDPLKLRGPLMFTPEPSYLGPLTAEAVVDHLVVERVGDGPLTDGASRLFLG